MSIRSNWKRSTAFTLFCILVASASAAPARAGELCDTFYSGRTSWIFTQRFGASLEDGDLIGATLALEDLRLIAAEFVENLKRMKPEAYFLASISFNDGRSEKFQETVIASTNSDKPSSLSKSMKYYPGGGFSGGQKIAFLNCQEKDSDGNNTIEQPSDFPPPPSEIYDNL